MDDDAHLSPRVTTRLTAALRRLTDRLRRRLSRLEDGGPESWI